MPNLCDSIESLYRTEKYRRIISENGFTLPLPPFMKRSILHRYAIDFSCTSLVETGTQYGDTPWFFRNKLDAIYTIELSRDLARLAGGRFQDYSNIHVVEGDSGKMIAEVIPKLTGKTLFWLDGHYSSGVTAQGVLDCPIVSEIMSIIRNCSVPYIILIDDARCFGRDKDYPTFQQLQGLLDGFLPEAAVGITDDILHIIPKSTR